MRLIITINLDNLIDIEASISLSIHSNLAKKIDFVQGFDESEDLQIENSKDYNKEIASFQEKIIKLEQDAHLIEAKKIKLQNEYFRNEEILNEKKEELANITALNQELEFVLEGLEFDLQEKKVQESLNRKYQEQELQSKKTISAELAHSLTKRAELLREMNELEFNFDKKLEIYSKIDEIEEDSSDLLDFTAKIKEQEGFFSGFEEERNIEVEILEIRQRIMNGNRKKQDLVEKIDSLLVILGEIDREILKIGLEFEDLNRERSKLQTKIVISQENIGKNEEKSDKSKEIREIKEDANTIDDFKLRSRSLSAKKMDIELQWKTKIGNARAEREKLNRIFREFVVLMKKCREMESQKRAAYRAFEEERRKFRGQLSIWNKNKEEIDFFLSKADFNGF